MRSAKPKRARAGARAGKGEGLQTQEKEDFRNSYLADLLLKDENSQGCCKSVHGHMRIPLSGGQGSMPSSS